MKLLHTALACAVLALLVASISAAKLTDTQAQGLFIEFARRYNKSYELDDFFKRFQVFRDNVQWIIDWNDDKSNTHTVGVNYFADMTPDEWTHYMGLKAPSDWKEPDYAALEKRAAKDDPELMELRRSKNYGLAENYNWKDEAPPAHDWHDEGIMLPIRNQQSCGSCFSYSAMACVEALRALTFPNDPKEYLSVQQGLDCTRPYGCYGCQGGWMASVFEYLVDIKGACKDADYPYRNRVTTCRDKQCEKAFRFDKYRNISGASADVFQEHLAVNPLAIAVTSATREFMYYKSGVITNCGSRSAQIDHAVVAVGYNNKESKDANGRTLAPFINIRNSWGTSWGDQGFVKVAIDNNTCKYRANVSYPVVQAPTSPATPATTPAPAR